MKKHRDICFERSQLKAGLTGFGNKPVIASSLLPQFTEFSAVTARMEGQHWKAEESKIILFL